ncbi:MAG: flagellar hook-associated protein FlgK [Christensenellaceae bacterium]|jgi:flagellar hook-associated protein 1 FlgK
MRSTFYGLEIAKTGLFTSSNQLDLTGHNISNVNTVGYTRQRFSTAALPPLAENTYINVDRRSVSGRGVETICIEQIRNPFLDYQYRKENATATGWNMREQYFEYMEALFNDELEKIDTNSGMTSIFKTFYNALYALTESPADQNVRTNVRENALKLTESMNYYYDRLMAQQDTLNETIRVSVNEINEIMVQIADLNEQIFGYELNGARANDLRDTRNVLLDTLSGIADIEFSEDSNGQLRVKLDGRTMIHHTRYNPLAVNDDVPNPVDPTDAGINLYGIYWADADGNPTSEAVTVRSGAIHGYLSVRDGADSENVGIPYVIEQLNALCAKVAREFNEVHRQGYTIPKDINDTSVNGVDFFDESVPVTAKNFKLSAAIMASVWNIAASEDPVGYGENEQMGNNKNALLLTDLIHKTDESGKPVNLDAGYKELLTLISTELGQIHTKAKTQSTMLGHIDQQRISISGVSLDEEMTNLIRFNHAYSAASRMITAIDEELDTLINKMGLVGRS